MKCSILGVGCFLVVGKRGYFILGIIVGIGFNGIYLFGNGYLGF